jgi:methylaspartate ammonia-lyase
MKSKINKEDMINLLIELRLVQNFSIKSLIEYLEKTGYKKTQCYQYIKWMRDRIKEDYTKTNQSIIEETVFQYEEMLRISKEKGDIRMWNDLKKELNKLLGLYSAEKIDITSGGDKITEIRLIQVNKKDE